MSSSQHYPETDSLTERANITFQNQLLRCLCCDDESNRTNLLPLVEFAYNAIRALGIEHATFEANFGFAPEEQQAMLLRMRPSIHISRDATERLQ
jgi:hypothetical protein